MKQKIAIIIGFLVFLVISLESCGKKDNEIIEQLDYLAETKPQLALKKVIRVDSNNFCKYEQMRLSLIKYKIEDKLFVCHKSDNIINNLYNYFQKYGTLNDKLQCLYYWGSTYRDMGDFPAAAIMYEQAIELAESNTLDKKDSLTLSNVHSQAAEILYRIGDYKEALQQATVSYQIRRKLDAVDVVTYEDMGRLSESCGKMAQAKEFYQKALIGIINMDKASSYIDYLGEQLGFYTNNKGYDQAEFLYGIIKNNKSANIPANVYAAIASYFMGLNQTDSALKYTMTAYQQEERSSNKAELAQNIALIARKKGNQDMALQYAVLAMGHYNSAQEDVNAEGVNNAKARWSLEEIRQARMEKQRKQQQKKEYYMVGVIVLLLVILAVSFLQRFINKRRNKLMEEMKRVKEEKEKIKTEHSSLQDKIKADRKLRAESAPEMASVMKMIIDLADSPKEKLQPDMWGAIFSAVDKLYPNLRQQLLSYSENLENKDLVLLYLMKLDFKQADIARIMKRAPSVISRKAHRIENMLGVPIKIALRDKSQLNNDEKDKDVSCTINADQ